MSLLQQMQGMMAQAHGGGGDPTLRGTFAKWNMEDASGSITAVDSSGNGHTLTISGPVTFGNTSILPSGKNTSVLAPSGTYLQLPSGFITALTRPFSIVTFARFTSLSSGHQLLCSASGGINWYVNNGAMIVGVAGISNNATDARTLAVNTNYMLGVTCSATGDVHFYVNKTASSVFTAAMSTTTGKDSARIGDYVGNPGVFSLTGYLQRFALCNVELSAAEMAAYYDALS